MNWKDVFYYSGNINTYLIKDKLFSFYDNEQGYNDFNEISNKPNFWEPIKQKIFKKISKEKFCHVLEFGAGRSGFAFYLGLPKKGIIYDVQDITKRNSEHYKNCSVRKIYNTELSSIKDKYDIIFSTFVWEHIYNPEEALAHLLSLLEVEGELIICSPRYDFPFYLSPSANHYSYLEKFVIALRLILERIKTLIGISPGFLIHLDPAIFHKEWQRDYDAVHWVSYYDLYKSLDKTKFSMRKIKIKSNSFMNLFYNHFMLLFVTIKRI